LPRPDKSGLAMTGGKGEEIATSRQVGTRNDKGGQGRGDCRASPFAMLRASARRNDDSVEGEEIAASFY
jgi:hypothetical protein